jgi:exodeoxyribonuclease V alpha subunit
MTAHAAPAAAPKFLGRSEFEVRDEADLDAVRGSVVRITFQAPDTGFCVVRVRPEGFAHLVTIVGRMSGIHAGARVHAQGVWTRHERHGLQLDVRKIRIDIPEDEKGLAEFLGSGLLPGIGPRSATKLVQTFGSEVLGIVEKNPGRLLSECRMAKEKVREVHRAWLERRRWIGAVQTL